MRTVVAPSLWEEVALGVDGAPRDSIALALPGLYWLACEHAEQADALGAGLLAGAAALPLAQVIGLGRDPRAMLAALKPNEGARRIRVLCARRRQLADAVRRLPADLRRLARQDGCLWVVDCAAGLLDALDDATLARLCRELDAWCVAGEHRLVWLCHENCATLLPRLLALNRHCAGVAQWYAQLGGWCWQVHFWAGRSGVAARRTYRVEPQGCRWRVLAEQVGTGRAETAGDGGDRGLYYAQAAALEGAPALSAAWRLVDSWDALMVPALQAQAASVVFALNGNAEVDVLARLLHRLRGSVGAALKLVVREMQPCLRYADERLLLGCGATLVVPFGTPLARFLTLLETVQGEHWRGTLGDDVEQKIRAHRAPDAMGVIDVERFRALVGSALHAQAGSLESAVLALRPISGLRMAYVLRQLRMRRRGDLACVCGSRIVLFLFACRRDGVEAALGNLFHLSWREMFEGYELLAAYDVDALVASEPLATVAAVDRAAGSLPAAPSAARPRVLTPQPRRLGGRP